MRYFTILFDFDGTLADSEGIALRVVNTLAPEFGLKPLVPEEIPALKTMSAWRLLTERSGISPWNIFKLRRIEQRLRTEFLKHAEEFRVFEGVPEMMRQLSEAGYEIGVVSSNDPRVVKEALARAGVEPLFVHAGSKFFGKARAIREAMREYGIGRSRTVYVGDEIRDIEACKKVGIDMIAVGWGFNSGDALKAAGASLVETPAELVRAIAAR